MGKRTRLNEVHAGKEAINIAEDERMDVSVKAPIGTGKRQTRYRKETIGSSINEEPLVSGGIEATHMLQKTSRGTALQAIKGRKQVNGSAGKAAARQSKEGKSFQGGLSGDSRARKPFSWNSAQEIIALSELVKKANADAGQSLDNNSISWDQLALTVGQRLDHSLTRIQMYEKARRLKERYTRTCQQISQGKLNSFKKEEDDKIYQLSQQMWGTDEALRLQLEEEEHASPYGNLEKRFDDADNQHNHGSSSNDTEVEILKVNMEKENKDQRDPVCSSEPGQGKTSPKNGSHEQAKPDLDFTSQLNIHGIEGVTQKTFEVFHEDHQALLKELEKGCEAVLQDMQVKFLTMMNSAVRGGGIETPWMGGGGRIPSFDFIMQAPVSWDKMVDKCLAATSTNKPAAFESLYEQWQQQRLQELKLTSLKLQLMLDECKMEQEKLENRVFKKSPTSEFTNG